MKSGPNLFNGTIDFAAPKNDFSFAIILLILTFFSIWLNFLILITLIRKFRKISSSNKFVLNLILSNFIVSTSILPFFVMASFRKKWEFGQLWCTLSAFIYYLVMVASFQTLGHIAIDRYYAIVRPLTYSKELSRIKCLIMICGTWVQSAMVLVPPVLTTPEVLFAYNPALGFCVVRWEANTLYSAVVFVACIALPLLLMMGTYFQIYRVMQSLANKLYLLRPPDAYYCPMETSEEAAKPLPSVRKPSWMADFKYTPHFNRGAFILLIIVGTFVVTAAPMVILGLSSRTDLPDWVHQIVLVMLVFGQVCYPIVYGFLNRHIRKDLFLMLRQAACHCCSLRTIASRSKETKESMKGDKKVSKTLSVQDLPSPMVK